MKRRILKHCAVGVALLLACTPTEPCACPPSRTSVFIYGEVRTAEGALVPGATLQFVLAPAVGVAEGSSPCEFDPARNDADPKGATTDSNGHFGTQIFSLFSPATRCLQVVASAAAGSARVEGLLVPFRAGVPERVGLVLTLR